MVSRVSIEVEPVGSRPARKRLLRIGRRRVRKRELAKFDGDPRELKRPKSGNVEPYAL